MHKRNFGLLLTLFIACNAQGMMQEEMSGSPASERLSINGSSDGNYQRIAQPMQPLTREQKIEHQEGAILLAFKEKGSYDTNSKLLLVVSGVAAANCAKDLVESCATKDPYSLYTFCSTMANMAISGTALGFALHNHSKKVEQSHTIDSLLQNLDDLTQETSRPDARIQRHSEYCNQFELYGARVSGLKGLFGIISVATLNAAKDIGFQFLAPTQSFVNKESICELVNDGVAFTAAVCATVLIYRLYKQRNHLASLTASAQEEV